MHESRNRAAVSPSPREAVSGWVLEAIFPNGKQATIEGFGTESEANEWLGSARHVAWLRDTRTAFSIRAVVATFEYLNSYAAILTAAASAFLQSARRRWSNMEVAHGQYRTTCEILALLRALALACIAGLTHWRSIVCRCLVVAIGALLIVSAAVAILAAVLAPLGRSKQPAEFAPGTPQKSATGPVVPARSSEGTQISDPIAVFDRARVLYRRRD
jgi:hypothetical protein